MFYDKYAKICKQRGISNSAAAVAAGLSKSLVTKWKTNKVETPSPEVLEKLSAYFNIPISELLGEDEVGIKKEQLTEYDGLSDNKKLLMEYVMSVSDEKAEKFYRFLKSIEEADL